MNNDPAAFRIDVNDQVYLSALNVDDKLALLQNLNVREIHDCTLRIPFPYTEADAEEFLRMDAEDTRKRGHPVRYAIRDASARAIGGCGFEGLVYGHRTEIGYWLAKPSWGQGITTSVIGTLCDFAFAEWKLVRITAHVFDFNTASVRVLEKNGFTLEGRLRKHYRKDGKFIDAKLYALVQ